MANISFSQWSTWAACPEHWRLKYVVGPRIDDSTIDTILGHALHTVIQDWLKDLYSKNITYANNQDRSVLLKEELSKEFKEKTIIENGSPRFVCDKPTLVEYYNHGCLILNYLQTNYKKIFPVTNTILLGVEKELSVSLRNGVVFKGFIDVITQNTTTGIITIHDLKKSKSGWSDYQKRDATKMAQLLLYKRFYARQFDVPEKMINVEFIIMKQTVFTSPIYVVPRITKHIPANGTPSINKAENAIMKFVDECFNTDGEYVTDNIVATPSKSACRFCPYNTTCPVSEATQK